MFYRTAESVSPKHPDKLCDQISDAILDAYFEQDPNARVAAEACGGHGVVFVTGEITSTADVDIPAIVKRIAGDNIEVHTKVVKQSPEIAQGVDTGGAGDQGIMIGYACDETPELLPREVVLARRLNQFIYEKHPYDGKTQITLRPDGELDSVVVSFQNVSTDDLTKLVWDWLEKNELVKQGRSVSYFSKAIIDNPKEYAPLYEDNDDIRAYINPAGDWNQGGFDADTGLTGRKLIVDNYGPRVAIGGGCYSGKDPSKVDRSAAYMARRIAVDYLRKRNAHEVLVRLAYAIGFAEPLEKTVIIDGKAEEIEGYDLTPNGIIKFLDLKRPIYEATARYGHYGEGFDWDK